MHLFYVASALILSLAAFARGFSVGNFGIAGEVGASELSFARGYGSAPVNCPSKRTCRCRMRG